MIRKDSIIEACRKTQIDKVLKKVVTGKLDPLAHKELHKKLDTLKIKQCMDIDLRAQLC